MTEADIPVIVIRPLEIGDAAAVAELACELGYPVTAEAMEHRIEARDRLAGNTVFVACAGERVAGWIDVCVVNHLQADPYGEIGGLVVSSDCRNSGIGAALVRHAEEWVRQRGLTKIVVRSRTTRDAAHRFYLREGYDQIKTSVVFSKKLN